MIPSHPAMTRTRTTIRQRIPYDYPSTSETVVCTPGTYLGDVCGAGDVADVNGHEL
jgi:hypothetical protein